MSRFDFQSPGAAFTDTMAQVLAERKAEERQKMLDSLTQAADQRAQQQMEQDAAWREKQYGLQQAADERAQVDFIGAGLDPNDTDISDNLSPEKLALLAKYARASEIPGASVSTGTAITNPEDGSEIPIDATQAEPAPKSTWRYTGDREFQEKERRKQETSTLIRNMLANPEQAKMAEGFARVANANGGVLPEGMLSMLGPDTPAYSFDAEKNELTDTGKTLPPNAQVFNRSHPPRQLADPNPREVGVTEDGYTIYSVPDGNGGVKEVIGTKRRAVPDTAPSRLTDGMINKHQDNIIGMGDGDVTPEDIAAFKYTALNMIRTIKAPQRVKDIARLYINDPASAARRLAVEEFTDQEISLIEELNDMTQAREFALWLRKNEKPLTVPKAKTLTDVMINRQKP